MRELKILTGAVAISLALSGAALAAEAPAPAAAAAPAAGPSDKAQIQALERGFAAAFNAKDVRKIMSYYTHEGLFVFDVVPPRQYVGWAAYKKDWDDLFAGFPGPVSFALSDLSITVAGDVAYGHSIQDSHFTAKDGGKTELVVRVTDVYRKVGGKWLIVQEHVSVPVDLDTMKPDPLSKP
ncbi:YybH family protein [Phenylobacterium sp.]|uniref:YybH family protein n=1 Tax=Phenylobacterium sp. TaxID=1871053 RepID=UPI002C335049|nr:nuclear transport factor 2 family protein [Phenylobacterium sp.]HLZ74117.1 nuclear transport factor 2 family protein [Phenylobacterium sp.]